MQKFCAAAKFYQACRGGPYGALSLERNADGIHNFAKHDFGGLGFFLQRGVTRTGDDAMSKNRDGELLEIVGQAKIAIVQKGPGLGSALQHERAARADAERELIGMASAVDDFEGVVDEAGIDFNVGDGFLHGQDVGDVGDRFERADWIVRGAAAQDGAFGFVRWIAHFHAHKETVELGFGERVCAVMLDGILRGDDEEGLRELQGAAVDGDLGFVHGFEKCGLGARGGAIDFVGENDVGEDGAGAKFEVAGFGIVDADPENIAGQKIGSELNALESAMEGARKSLGKSGLANAGNVFDEQMSAGEKGDEGELDDIFFAENGAGNGALELRYDMRGGGRHC
jgi:hypothetical protein